MDQVFIQDLAGNALGSANFVRAPVVGEWVQGPNGVWEVVHAVAHGWNPNGPFMAVKIAPPQMAATNLTSNFAFKPADIA